MSDIPSQSPGLSHVGADGRAVMVDVGGKAVSRRTARARAEVRLVPAAAALFDGTDLQSKKGPVFHTATLAGIMAAKRTHELIPLCHPLPLDDCRVDIRLEDEGRVIIETLASAEARTGVEMEALTAASVAALTVYDMVKAVGLGTVIGPVTVVEKTGGKSDYRSEQA
ncbi:MAG: cyclic pyranopterin monophosphate synthase MoaC [Verrucomicrobia bacterium]|nr:MAG: cyclic pyranopterin monophosphate synthase MoaC [Verrucomicrobiota bacterium]